MKQIYSLLFYLLSQFCSSTSWILQQCHRKWLHLENSIIQYKDHTVQDYAGLYVTYETSDIDKFYENDGSVLDMYSENPAGVDPYNYSITATNDAATIQDCYNREHIIPQSVFSSSPMVSMLISLLQLMEK
jgi:hypothetical protein